MKWSWSIGRIAGIDIRVHATFLLLVAFYALGSWALEGHIIHGMRMGVFMLALFGCIVLHELGHALTAKRFGIATRDITLLPIGGIARLETTPEEPRKELLIAVAGPVVSAAIAAAFYGANFLAGGTVDNWFPWGGVPLLQQLGAANLFLVLFNLLPAFPMDGGRILRAALAPRLGSLRATEIATRVGQFAAVIFGLTGLFFNPMLVLIAVLIWFGAEHEIAAVQMRGLLRDIPVSQIMRSNVHVLGPTAALEEAAALLLRTGQRDFPIIDGHRVVGMLNREGLIQAIAEFGADAPVWLGSSPDGTILSARDSACDALERMRAKGQSMLPVARDGSFAGVLCIEDFQNFALMNKALDDRSGAQTATGSNQEQDETAEFIELLKGPR